MRAWGGEYSMGYCSHARYKFVCCVLCVLISLCVFSCFRPVLGGAVLPVAMDGSGWVSSLSVALDVVWGLLCIAFTFV